MIKTCMITLACVTSHCSPPHSCSFNTHRITEVKEASNGDLTLVNGWWVKESHQEVLKKIEACPDSKP